MKIIKINEQINNYGTKISAKIVVLQSLIVQAGFQNNAQKKKLQVTSTTLKL